MLGLGLVVWRSCGRTLYPRTRLGRRTAPLGLDIAVPWDMMSYAKPLLQTQMTRTGSEDSGIERLMPGHPQRIRGDVQGPDRGLRQNSASRVLERTGRDWHKRVKKLS